MAKPRALGSDSVTLICAEAVEGTAPDGAGGGVYTMPALVSNGLDGSQPLEADPLINTGNPDDSDPSAGSFDTSGDLVAPLDARGAGFWMTMAFGVEAPDPTHDVDAGTYLHTWQSGKDLKSYTIQRGYPKLTTPKWRTALGAKAGGFNFPLARNGRVKATLGVVARSSAKDNAGARDAAPLTFARRPFDNASAGIKIGGTPFGNVTGAQFNYSNGLDTPPSIRADNFIDGTDETIRTLTGTIDIRIGTDHTIDDLLDAEGSAAMEFAFALKAAPTWVLKFTMPRVFFERPKEPISGPGGIQATVNWRAAHDTDAGYMLQATLLNDVAAY